MIAIKVNAKRFFAYTDGLVEWKDIEHPMRTYIDYKCDTPQELLEFISSLK